MPPMKPSKRERERRDRHSARDRVRRMTVRELLGDCPETYAMHIVRPSRIRRYPTTS